MKSNRALMGCWVLAFGLGALACSSDPDPGTGAPAGGDAGSSVPDGSTGTSSGNPVGPQPDAGGTPVTGGEGTGVLTIDGVAVPVRTPLVVQEDAQAECDNFSFNFGVKTEIPVGSAQVWFSFSAKAPGLKPGFAPDAIDEPSLDITYNDPELGIIQMGTNKSFSDRVWSPKTGERIQGSYGYLVTPTINATGAKSDKKRDMLFTYDFAFPPRCAAK